MRPTTRVRTSIGVRSCRNLQRCQSSLVLGLIATRRLNSEISGRRQRGFCQSSPRRSRVLCVSLFSYAVIALTTSDLTFVCLCSNAIKEKAYVSQAVVATLVGIAVGPVGLDWVNISLWTDDDQEAQEQLTLVLTKIVLGIQVLFTGISLPRAYNIRSWRSLGIVLFRGPKSYVRAVKLSMLPALMISMWMISSLLIWAIFPNLAFIEAMAIGACITPTDPVLAASVVRGGFAEQHVPPHLRNLIAAESGANDGLGYPFIFLALHLCNRAEYNWSLTDVFKEWVGVSILYDLCLSVFIGIILGFIARRLLKAAKVHGIIDHESFLAYGLGLSFFCLGAVGVIGSDDLLSCFVAGNSFTFDDFFKEEMRDHSFQDVIDNLLDSAIFIFFGTQMPWSDIGNAAHGLGFIRLVGLIVSILVLRRLPVAWLLHSFIPDLKTRREALFFGHFGPIGVGALFYAQVVLKEVSHSRTHLREVVSPIVSMVVLGSVLVHGITIPVALLSTRLAGGSGLQTVDERTPLLLDVGKDASRCREGLAERHQINGDPSPSHGKDVERQQRDDHVADGEDDEAHSVADDRDPDELAYIEGSEVVIEGRDGHVKRHKLRPGNHK